MFGYLQAQKAERRATLISSKIPEPQTASKKQMQKQEMVHSKKQQFEDSKVQTLGNGWKK